MDRWPAHRRAAPRELYISAEQNQANFEVGLAALESEKAWAETDAEGVDLDVEKAADQVMPQLMEQDHHPDQDQEPPDVL